MKIFISWSGEPSRLVAEALRGWLPQVIQAVQPWMSASDLDKGARWAAEVAGQLEGTKVGILCLTRANLTAPWLLFEAGALSKTLVNTYVCPYLLGLEVTDIQGPLAQFQATRTNRDDTLRLVKTINSALGNGALTDGQVDAAFAKWWPDLEPRLTQAAAVAAQGDPAAPARTDRSILEEILDLVRTAAREASESERRDILNRAIGTALGAADLGMTRAALAQFGQSPIEQALGLSQKDRLQAVMERLAGERKGLLFQSPAIPQPQPPEPPPEPPPKPPLKLSPKPRKGE